MHTLGSGLGSVGPIELQIREDGGSQKEKKRRGEKEEERGSDEGIEKKRENLRD